MAGDSPFSGLLQGLQAIGALQNIQMNKTAQDIDLLRMFMLQQKAASEQQAQEQILQGQEILSKALAEVDYSDDPTTALPQIGLGLSLMGKSENLKPIAELFDKLKQRNMYLAAVNMIDAYRTGNSVSFIKNLEKMERYRTNMPWQAIIRNVGKGTVDVEFVMPMPDGTSASRKVRYTEEDLLRLAAQISEDPQKFATAHETFAQLPHQIALLNAQTFERQTQGRQNLASARKLIIEGDDIEATRPGRLLGLDLANIQKRLENDKAILANAQNQVEAALFIGRTAANYGDELMNKLNTPELGLPTTAMPALKSFATLMAKAQLTGQNVDATVASQEFAIALKNKLENNAPFTDYKIEVFDIIPPEIKRMLKGLPPQPGDSGTPLYPPTVDRETGKGPVPRPAGSSPASTATPGRVPTLEEQRKIIEDARKAGLIKKGYAFSSPTVPRILVSESDAHALRQILGIQFTVTSELPTDVTQNQPTPPPTTTPPALQPTEDELRQTNPWGP